MRFHTRVSLLTVAVALILGAIALAGSPPASARAADRILYTEASDEPPFGLPIGFLDPGTNATATRPDVISDEGLQASPDGTRLVLTNHSGLRCRGDPSPCSRTRRVAPFLVAATPPVLLVLDEGASADRSSVLRIGVISTALSLGAALLLLAIGAMEGPVFEVFPSPLVEVVALTAVGAIGGIGFGWWRTR